MANIQEGQYRVFAHYRNWAVQQVHITPNGTGYCSSASDRICELYNRHDALEIAYLLNGWGFPKFTLSENATDRELAYKAQDIISEHDFKRNQASLSESVKVRKELFAKANVERFKHVVSLISNPCIRRDLKQLWLLTYNYNSGEVAEDDYKIMRHNLVVSINSVS